jgi:hypothetical protein
VLARRLQPMRGAQEVLRGDATAEP